MKIGKIELTKEKSIIVVSVVIIVIALGVYLVFYAPLMRQLKTKYLECKSIESQVIQAWDIIGSVGKTYGERVIMTEEDVSRAIDALTKHGKLKGINFISISSKEEKKERESQYIILPIEMKIEATYEQLGIFLGSLDEPQKGLVKVKSFDIVPGEKDPSKLTTDLVVDIYLSRKENAE